MNKFKIILLCVLAAITYGIIHDQITAHLCVEYFTLAHPPIFHTESATILGLCWGVFATIGIGAVLGVTLAGVSQSKGAPAYPIPKILRSILILMGVMALSAFTAGMAGYELSRHGIIHLPGGFADIIPEAKHDRFMGVWFAHCASYFSGIAGGAYLITHIWNQRGRPRVIGLIPRSRFEIVRAFIVAAAVAAVVYLRFIRP